MPMGFVRDRRCRAGTRTMRPMRRMRSGAAPSAMTGAGASFLSSKARSYYFRRAPPGAPDDPGRVEFAELLLLAPIVDRDPANENSHHGRDQQVGGDDIGRVRAKRHRVHAIL